MMTDMLDMVKKTFGVSSDPYNRPYPYNSQVGAPSNRYTGLPSHFASSHIYNIFQSHLTPALPKEHECGKMAFSINLPSRLVLPPISTMVVPLPASRLLMPLTVKMVLLLQVASFTMLGCQFHLKMQCKSKHVTGKMDSDPPIACVKNKLKSHIFSFHIFFLIKDQVCKPP
ncbi:uncharacterized protein M6D78_013261 isoform 1-T1 [Vipera latastei]